MVNPSILEASELTLLSGVEAGTVAGGSSALGLPEGREGVEGLDGVEGEEGVSSHPWASLTIGREGEEGDGEAVIV